MNQPSTHDWCIDPRDSSLAPENRDAAYQLYEQRARMPEVSLRDKIIRLIREGQR